MSLKSELKKSLKRRVREGTGEPWDEKAKRFLQSKNFRIFGDQNQWARKELGGWVLQFRNWYPGRVEYSVSYGRKRSQSGNAPSVERAFAEQSKLLEKMQRLGSTAGY